MVRSQRGVSQVSLGFYGEIFAHCRLPVVVVVVPEFVQVVAPPEALSLFGAALPGQQVLTLNLLGQTLVKTAPPPGTQCRVSLSSARHSTSLHTFILMQNMSPTCL